MATPSVLRRSGRDVLIVAGDPGETDLLTTALQLAGYTVAGTAVTGVEGVARITRRRFDLVVWDAMLPDLRDLSNGPRVASADIPPLLYLISCDYLHTLLPNFGRRKEDYVTKPVRATEVLARAEVLLRDGRTGPVAVTSGYAELTLDDATCQARRGSRALGLTPAEYRLLRYLLANAECVVSKEQISQHVWGDFRASEAIDKLVSRLRQKVNQEEPALIHTSRGFGYWLGRLRG
ncbi:response regulator transcription factor [Streptomyces justiciae]|uniref:response regulator transcription factor n=1 Tax=Streptomyces justiciae TaxID=2780140 RepID=UPI001880C53D|nr:response regulator transcription factor [Streptomyces justiciae]MBE8472213.1 response regulator transcription factor [Streptomyces justiciae]